MDHDERIAWAQFRFSVIAPLVCRKIESEDERRALRNDILNQIYVMPNGQQKRISSRTLNEWLMRHKVHGFEGLLTVIRRTRGTCRAIPEEILHRAIELRREEPARSCSTVLSILAAEGFDVTKFSKSTLNFQLNKHGATKSQLSSEKGAFQRWEQKYANALWQADTSHGLWLPDPANPKKVKRTKLISFIDDASRVCTHAEFYWDERLPSLIDCFRKALLKRGKPDRMLCDNAFIYHSKTVSLMCAQLPIEVSFCREYAPEGKGKVEKHYGTIKNAFYREAEHAGITTLDELNKFFWAWLTKEYHNRLHSSLNMTPIERWRIDEPKLTRVSTEDIRRALMLRAERKVNMRTATIRLDNRQYQLSPRLAGTIVEVRWHAGSEESAEIWQDGKQLEMAHITTASTNIDFERKPAKKETVRGITYASSKNYRRALVSAHEGEAPFAGVASPGPDEYLAEGEFISLVVRHLGKTLSLEESSILSQFFFQCSPLRANATEKLLQQAVNAKGARMHLRYYLEHIRRSTFQKRK